MKKSFCSILPEKYKGSEIASKFVEIQATLYRCESTSPCLLFAYITAPLGVGGEVVIMHPLYWIYLKLSGAKK